MFSALLAAVAVILAAFLQKLKNPPKHLRLLICLLTVICIVFVILAITKEKGHEDNENTEPSITVSIYIINNYFFDLQKEEIKETKEYVNIINGITSPEMTEEKSNRIKERLFEQD